MKDEFYSKTELMYEIWKTTQYCPVNKVNIPIHERVAVVHTLAQVVEWLNARHVEFNIWHQSDQGYYIRKVRV